VAITLILTRHGLTDRSDPEQHLGQSIDIGLSAAGRGQADALALRIGGEHFDRIVSSPLRRATETARIVAGDRPVESDPRLREMDYGAWEGMTYEELEARDAATRARFVEDPASNACPGGESGDDVAVRVRSFLADLIGWADGRDQEQVVRMAGQPERIDPADTVVLAVAHSTLNRVLLCVAVGIPIREYRRRFTQSQANLTVLRWAADASPEEARILVVNDVSHVAAHGQAPWEPSPGA
jgi:broad specificity phosphatase PhoE